MLEVTLLSYKGIFAHTFLFVKYTLQYYFLCYTGVGYGSQAITAYYQNVIGLSCLTITKNPHIWGLVPSGRGVPLYIGDRNTKCISCETDAYATLQKIDCW
jgi:hypothetical protein